MHKLFVIVVAMLMVVFASNLFAQDIENPPDDSTNVNTPENVVTPDVILGGTDCVSVYISGNQTPPILVYDEHYGTIPSWGHYVSIYVSGWESDTRTNTHASAYVIIDDNIVLQHYWDNDSGTIPIYDMTGYENCNYCIHAEVYSGCDANNANAYIEWQQY